jgi:hypothetical protein
MKRLLVLPIFFLLVQLGYSQTNVVGIHQLVDANQEEFERQKKARDNQALVNANESVNRTQLQKLQVKYAEIQDRYSTLGTAISAARIGVDAYPILNNIINSQKAIIREAGDNPILYAVAFESEKQFVQKANRLVSYMIGLVATIGDINQMKAGDRTVLFNHVIVELRQIAAISRNLAMTMTFNTWQNQLKNATPFHGWVNKDKAIVEDIMRIWKLY